MRYRECVLYFILFSGLGIHFCVCIYLSIAFTPLHSTNYPISSPTHTYICTIWGPNLTPGNMISISELKDWPKGYYTVPSSLIGFFFLGQPPNLSFLLHFLLFAFLFIPLHHNLLILFSKLGLSIWTSEYVPCISTILRATTPSILVDGWMDGQIDSPNII